MMNQQLMTFLKLCTALNKVKLRSILYKNCSFNLIHDYTDLQMSDTKKKTIFSANSNMLYNLNENNNLRKLLKVYDKIK